MGIYTGVYTSHELNLLGILIRGAFATILHLIEREIDSRSVIGKFFRNTNFLFFLGFSKADYYCCYYRLVLLRQWVLVDLAVG